MSIHSPLPYGRIFGTRHFDTSISRTTRPTFYRISRIFRIYAFEHVRSVIEAAHGRRFVLTANLSKWGPTAFARWRRPAGLPKRRSLPSSVFKLSDVSFLQIYSYLYRGDLFYLSFWFLQAIYVSCSIHLSNPRI